MQRICVDMDEVMADTLAEHLRRYNQTFDEEVTPQDLAGKGLWEIAPLDRRAVDIKSIEFVGNGSAVPILLGITGVVEWK